MARGWESKDVGDQQSRGRVHVPAGHAPPPAECLRINRLKALQLDRARVQRELAGATDERFRQQLRSSLIHLDTQIALFTQH